MRKHLPVWDGGAAFVRLGLAAIVAVSLASCGEQNAESDVASVSPALQADCSISLRTETFEQNVIKPRLAVTNLGSEPLSNFALHFYFTTEGGKAPVLEDYYTPLSEEVVVPLGSISEGLHRLEYRYVGQTIEPNQTLPDTSGSVVGLHYADWSNWDRTNDYSMADAQLEFVETDRVVLVDSQGYIVCGVPPAGVPGGPPGGGNGGNGGNGNAGTGNAGTGSGGMSGGGASSGGTGNSSGEGGMSGGGGSNGGSGGEGGSGNPPAGSDVQFSFKLPRNVPRQEIALAATGGRVKIGDYARVLETDGYAAVSSVSSFASSEVHLEDFAKTGTVWSEAKTQLDDYAHVFGDVFSKGLWKQPSATIDGATNAAADVRPLESVEWSVFFPEETQGPQFLSTNESRTLTPGAYSTVVVPSGAHLHLSAGHPRSLKHQRPPFAGVFGFGSVKVSFRERPA